MDSLWIYIVIGVAVVLVVVVVIIVITSKKKKAQAEAERLQKEKEQKEKEEQTLDDRIVVEEQEEKTEEPEMVEVEPEMIPELKVMLTRVGNIEHEVRDITITDELVIGRKATKADLVFENDASLSSAHCKLTYKDGHLYIEDMGSLNGTLVNGVPIKEVYQLHSDDKIYIGSMEWRISW